MYFITTSNVSLTNIANNITAAPIYPLNVSTSPIAKNDIILANTGSRENIRTALTGVVYRCTAICINDTINDAIIALNNNE